MDIKRYIIRNTLRIKVIPGSHKDELVEKDNALKLYLQAMPEKDKANRGLITFFKKEFGLVVRIKSGLQRREKVLEVLDLAVRSSHIL